MSECSGVSGIHYVVYVGAVGAVIGAHLTLSPGDHLTFISRKDFGLIREYGLGAYGAAPGCWLGGADFRVLSSLREVTQPINWLIVAAPTHAFEAIACDISECPAVNDETRVLLLNNGWIA